MTTKRPIFIVSTEGKSSEQMKADAREALRQYDDHAMMWPFVAELVGHEPQRFKTLQEAMSHAESIDGVTGVLRCLGVDVVSYDGGAVALAAEFDAPDD